MSFARGYRRSAAFADPPPITRSCDHPGCTAGGEHRAPKSRRALNEYWWFCLDHVREYNKAWNYYAGMSPEEIERHAREDTVWQRPTWKLGARFADRRLRERVWQRFGLGGSDEDPFDLGHRRTGDAEEGAAGPRPPRRQADAEFDSACETLGLTPPFDLKQVKIAYKALVKRHHPDANGGSPEAEEKLKSVNHAFAVLKTRLFA